MNFIYLIKKKKYVKEMAYLPLKSVGMIWYLININNVIIFFLFDFKAFLTNKPLYAIYGIQKLINFIKNSIKKSKIDENSVEEGKEMLPIKTIKF